MNTLTSAFGSLQLYRFPVKANESLQAWDAADEYLLAHLAEANLLNNMLRPLIINDSFGALSLHLAEFQPYMQSDSYLSQQALYHNLSTNHLAENQVTFLTSLEQAHGQLSLVLIKIPKSLAMLEDQLYRLKPLINDKTIIIGAAMAKHIHSSTLKLFESILGKTTTSLAKKKARLVFCEPDMALATKSNPYPKSYRLEKPPITLINHANVFAQSSLDIGSRFFIDHLPRSEHTQTIVDLGCGDGVIGIVAAYQNPYAEMIFTDESYMAVDCAKLNFEHALPTRTAKFITTNCLDGISNNSVDIILNNPPFHQQHAIGDHIAWQMFNESLRALKRGGALWVIGNRHLNYHIKLNRIFDNCETMASNQKFVILRARK